MSVLPLRGPGPVPSPLPARLAGIERALVMGVVNVTPDSFSDGGLWFERDRAVEHGLALMHEGADVVDVGGESTRPGAARVTLDEELRRVIPVVTALVDAGAVVSVDTLRAAVAQRAVDAGAAIVNDVSGGLADEEMAPFVARSGVPYVLGHWRGHSDVMDGLADYDDVVEDVLRELRGRVALLERAGADPAQIVLDPGLGFAKPGVANWPLLARLDELLALGRPVLVGASRKRFLGHVLALGRGGEVEVPPAERDHATAAVSALAARAGVWAVRVHDVPASRDAVLVAAAWRGAERGPAGRRPGSAP